MSNNYVISLTSATERRKHIETEFGKQAIPFQFFDAITPNLIEQTVKKLNLDISNCNLTQTEIACALSHISLWHLAKAENLDYICIFEDDIYLGEDVKPFLNDDYIDDNVDIIKLEKNIEIIETEATPKKIWHNRKLYTLKSVHAGAAGYIITKKGIEYLVKNVSALTEIEVDNIIFKTLLNQPGYTVWQLLPAVCIQSAIAEKDILFETTIFDREERNQRIKKRLNLMQKIVRELSRLSRKIRQNFSGKQVTFK